MRAEKFPGGPGDVPKNAAHEAYCCTQSKKQPLCAPNFLFEGGFFFIAEPGQQYDALLTQIGPSSIRGERQQEALLQYQAAVGRHNEQLRVLREELAEANQERRFRTASEITKRLDSAAVAATNDLDGILATHRGTTLSAYLLARGMQRGPLEEMERLYADLDEQELQTQPAQIYASFIAELKALNIGSKAPDFRLADQEGGRTLALRDQWEIEDHRFLGVVVRSLPDGKPEHGAPVCGFQTTGARDHRCVA